MSEEYIWNVMESDAEDENLYEIITEHFEAVTEFFQELDYVAFLHRPDVIFALLVALLCSVYLIVWCTGDSSWQLAVRNRLTGLLLLSQGCKGGGENDSWEQKTERVVVYAIRGRRDKMEDRFVSQTVKDTKVQINAVFDGHGGEVSRAAMFRQHFVLACPAATRTNSNSQWHIERRTRRTRCMQPNVVEVYLATINSRKLKFT